LALAAGFLCLVATRAAAQPPPEGPWTLVFEDEFSGTTADLDRNWQFQNGPSTHILCSRWRENAVVENGLCRLLNKRQQRGGQEWTSASMSTKQEFQYGYFEARYRYAATTGLNNSFWIMNRLPKDAPGRFEIDINEGHFPNEVNTNLHNWSGEHWSRSKKFPIAGQDLSQEFHTYGLLWNHDSLVWYLDGQAIRQETHAICRGTAPALLSSAIMNWAGKVTDAIDGTSMDVDYVRIYQRPDAPPAAVDYDFAQMMRPAPVAARFDDPAYYHWGGSMVRGDDGKCHLFYSRWPRKLGHNAWVTHSEIAHAVADTPLGPMKHQDVALPPRGQPYWDGQCTHNPNVHRFGDKYYLYYMGNTGDGQATDTLNWTHRNNQRIGVAVADTPAGPWRRLDRPLIEPTPGFHDALCCSNPSVTQGPDGRYLMVYKAVGDQGPLPFGGPVYHGVATSDRPDGGFTKHPTPVFVKDGVSFAAEDPYVWSHGEKYWAIVKDNAGHFTGRGKSTALFESDNGLDWRLAKHPLVATTEVRWDSGRQQTMHSLERPQLFFESGQPVVLMFAVDEDSRRDWSYHVRVPLGVGR
jgi:beta-glucanase (GH16 family)